MHDFPAMLPQRSHLDQLRKFDARNFSEPD